MGDTVTAEDTGELELSVGARGDEVGRQEAVRCLGGPLLLFAKAPEDEDAGKDNGKSESEPGALRYFQECGGEVRSVKCAEDEETEQDEKGV